MISSLLPFVIRGIGVLPLPIRRVMAAFIGTLVALVPARDRDICAAHLRRFLPDRKVTSGAVYRHLVTVLFESFNLNPLLENPRAIDASELTEYWKNREPNRGIIALSAHLGNWELLAAVAIRNQVPLHVVGREARRSAWQAALERIRHSYGVQVLWRADSAAVKKMIKALRAGEVIAALIDQDTEVRSIISTFFGLPAKTPCALVELGLQQNAKFVIALTVRLQDGSYKMIVKDLAVDRSSTVESMLHSYHRELESLIREYPDQWVWVHKRWRTRESGERYSSRDYLAMLEAK